MAEEILITDEVRKAIGTEASPLVIEIEKGAIRKFAQAIGDANPLWQDEEYAEKGKYSGIIAPPSFFCTVDAGMSNTRMEIDWPLKRLVATGDELEFFHPVRPGDVITSTLKLAEVQEKETKGGKRLFVTFEVAFTNQKGEMVAKGRVSSMRY